MSDFNPLDPKHSFELTKNNAIEAIKEYFPNGKFEGKRQSVHLVSVEAEDNLEDDDFVAQQEVKEKDGTWAVPIKAKVELRDNATGKVIDSKTMTIAKIPKITPRFSYIIDGKERQVDHQSLLKRGMYTRVADNGNLETRFNTKNPNQSQVQFQVFFDPDSHKYNLKMQDTEVPLMSVMRALGTSEDHMKSAWGKEVYQDNNITNDEMSKHLRRLYRKIYRKDTDNMDELTSGIRQHFQSLSLDPEVTKMVVKQPFEKVDGQAILAATKSLIAINKGDEKPTGYDDLRFKEIRHTDDFIAERIRESAKMIVPKLKNNLDRAERVDQVVSNNLFGKPVKSFFTNSQLSTLGDQTNPLGMITGHTKHTIMGEHGISDAHQVTLDAKIIHPSTYGFLDPLHTPESARTGISLQIPLGAWKEKGELKTRVINARTGKEEVVSAAQLASANVGFPDQYKLTRGAPPQPLAKRITVADGDGSTAEVDPKKVDYVFLSHANLFSATTNLIPFLAADNGNRVGYGTQQAHQALSLANREEPLVQSAMIKTPEGSAAKKIISGPTTFEEGLGTMLGHAAKTSGVVEKIDKNYIYVRGGADGKKIVKHALYNYFPTNNKKGMLHSTPLVKEGDVVKVGQPIADHSFTKGGKLALGTNLRAGFMTAEGYNFEDGIRISESARDQLVSEHLYKKEQDIGSSNIHLGKKKFVAMDQVRYKKEQLEGIGDDGVIAIGSVVKPGDPLVLALKKNEVHSEAEGLAKVSKGMVKDWKAEPIEWDGDTEGVVTSVIRTGKKIKVHVATKEPMQVGDKLVGRHGNKGIVTQILPDSEMPKYVDPITGEVTNLQVMLNPLGVPGRINAGQLLETSASLIAKKTGEPYKVKNFDSNVDDLVEKVQSDLQKHGLKPKTTVYDPKTGEQLGDVHLGYHYMMKLDQQVSKKMSARGAGYGNAYDGNKTAVDGGGRLGSLGNFAMLAHGAVHNLREMQTIKTSFDDETWRAIQTGQPIPTPKPSYAYEKFESFLKGMGVNISKEGNDLVLEPLTDKEIDKFSSGEVKDAGRMLRGKDLRAEKGGLFDPTIFGKEGGGLKGDRWGHITLDTPMPNPVFEEPILKLTGLRRADFESILSGQQEHNGKTGPQAIGAMLDSIDVQKEMKSLKKELETAHPSKVDNLNKRIRYLQNLDRMGLTPREAYMRSKIPVLPPLMRPVSELSDGSLNTDDLNGLYRGVGLVNMQLKKLDKDLKAMPEESGKLYASLYDGMKALTGVGTLPAFHQSKRDKLQGLMHKIEGPNPKLGFFQSKVMSRKQDMSMRSTIVPNQEISLDQIALPREGALKMYEPHLVRELRAMGMTTLGAKEAIKKNDRMVDKALEKVMNEVPVMAKRDPVLHKFGVQAFKPVIARGNAIEIHPLVVGGFNADFDGDAMAVFAPVTKEAIAEAHKMLPSKNLVNPTYNSIVPMPSQDAMVGAYMFTQTGEQTKHSFPDYAQAKKAFDSKQIKFNDVVRIGGKQTTIARMMLDRKLPAAMQGQIAYADEALNKKRLTSLLRGMLDEAPKEIPEFLQAVKDAGNQTAYKQALTISLDDIKVNKPLREKMFAEARKKEEQIRNTSGMTKKEKDARVVELYKGTLDKYDKALKEDLTRRGSSMITMMESGGMGKWPQVKQLSGAPVMFEDAHGEPVPVPVLKSYGEGLRLAEFLTAAHGARMGTLSKSQGTSEPGFLSKKIVNSTIGVTVTGDDCGTKQGVNMAIDDPDLLDRYLAADTVVAKGRILKRGTLITPEIRDTMRSNKLTRIAVRSPLKCAHGDGVCSKCVGLSDTGKDYEQGTAIGVISAQALGEPATQMAMNAFHCNHEDSLVFVRRALGETLCASESPYRHGLYSMRDLFDECLVYGVSKEGIEEVIYLPEGIEVWDHVRWVGVTHIRRHAPTENMVYVSTSGMATICQENHPLMEATEKEERMWAAGEMKGKQICYSKRPASWTETGYSYAESCEGVPGYVAGMYLSEGNINYRPAQQGAEKRPYSVVFTQYPGEVSDRLRKEVREWLGKEMSSHGKKGHVINSLEEGLRFERLFGRYSHGKKLPTPVMFYDRTWLADMLSGYIDGDGHVVNDKKHHNYYIQIETTSFYLAQAIPMICDLLGVHATLQQKPWRTRSKHQGFSIRVCPTQESATLLRKSVKVRAMTSFRTQPKEPVEGILDVRVVKDTKYTREMVYDLTTTTGTLTVGGLHHHNTGGVISAGQKTIRGGKFQGAKDLLDAKKTIAHSARLAPATGKITNIRKDPSGGYRVQIQSPAGTKEAYTPELRPGLVVGSMVKAGDPLSEGIINPHELLPLAGLDAVKQSMTDQLSASYDGVRKRHVEMVVRSLTDTAQVEDPGGRTDVMRGDMVSASRLAQMNATGDSKIKYRPILKGVNYLPLQSDDWAAKLNFNRLRDTITQGAAQGHRSNIHGTNPLPGLMYGAEFGKPPASSKNKF